MNRRDFLEVMTHSTAVHVCRTNNVVWVTELDCFIVWDFERNDWWPVVGRCPYCFVSLE